jgi:intermembrane space import and assembly protein 40
MQNCFRQHPDIYGAELDDDNDITADEHYDSIPPVAAAASSSEGASQSDTSSPPIIRAEKHEIEAKRERARATTKQVKGEHEPQSESDEVVPRAWHGEVNNEKRS